MQGAQPSETILVIADSVNDQILIQDFSSDLLGFQREIQLRPSDVHTRIVIVWYKETCSVDRDIVDSVGLTFDVDPTFLWAHFDHPAAQSDRLIPIDKARWEQGPEIHLPLLTSEQDSVTLRAGNHENHEMSTLFQLKGQSSQTSKHLSSSSWKRCS